MASQVYFQGDFYYATTSTSAGDSPLGAPEKWRRIDLPEELLSSVAMKAAGTILDGQGQHDKARQLEVRAQNRLDDQILKSGKGDLRHKRADVWTR